VVPIKSGLYVLGQRQLSRTPSRRVMPTLRKLLHCFLSFCCLGTFLLFKDSAKVVDQLLFILERKLGYSLNPRFVKMPLYDSRHILNDISSQEQATPPFFCRLLQNVSQIVCHLHFLQRTKVDRAHCSNATIPCLTIQVRLDDLDRLACLVRNCRCDWRSRLGRSSDSVQHLILPSDPPTGFGNRNLFPCLLENRCW